jgi:hypothetical protein
MKRYLLLFFLLLPLAGSAYAQSEFINGYIIKHDGTRSEGQIKYISKDFTPKECVFRWFDISQSFDFRPGDIEAFGFIYGIKYKTVTIRGDKIFMACLADGEVDLMYDGSTMYLDGDGLRMTPLNNRPGTVTFNGRSVDYIDYKDLLVKLDPGNRSFTTGDLHLRPEEIKKVIEALNLSLDANVELFATSNPSGVFEEMRNMGAYMNSFGIIAGMNTSRYYAEKLSPLSGFLPEMDFFELAPVMGVFYNRPLSRAKDVLALGAEVMVYKTNVYIYNESYDYRGILRSDINMGYMGIKVPLYLQIRLLKGKFHPIFNAGGFIMLNSGTQYTREGEIESALHVVKPFTDNSIILKKKIVGAMAGIGIKQEINPRQFFFIEARAEIGSGLYDWNALDQKTISLNLFVGIDFL